MNDISSKKIVDLTMLIDEEMTGVAITSAKNLAKDGWNASTLHLYSHSGTHMDAPIHFEVTKQTIEQIDANRLISEAWILDLTHLKPKALIGVKEMQPIEQKIKKGESILLHTGWSKKTNTEAYRNDLPRISADLAVWMGKKGVNIIGVESPSIADVNNIEEVTEIHTILMRNNVIIVEGLTNLEQLSKEKITLIAAPLKVKDGDGAPARVLALE
ncbi:cyclase family protein [Spongiivirga citrea]|uniref:Cyclase family protein n=1 Tax=Spongiivirga citrea TaxID=1481457 RepID=A0A6M0CLF2_9FLAO|nr:cyclase family protein [Spongiivirga citrea]NER17803.1 cyclase family protein [Spongiivirga citrea]